MDSIDPLEIQARRQLEKRRKGGRATAARGLYRTQPRVGGRFASTSGHRAATELDDFLKGLRTWLEGLDAPSYHRAKVEFRRVATELDRAKNGDSTELHRANDGAPSPSYTELNTELDRANYIEEEPNHSEVPPISGKEELRSASAADLQSVRPSRLEGAPAVRQDGTDRDALIELIVKDEFWANHRKVLERAPDELLVRAAKEILNRSARTALGGSVQPPS